MNQEQAISILIQVANLAQSKGALTIKEASIVSVAIETLTPTQEPQAPVVDPEKVIKTEPVKQKK